MLLTATGGGERHALMVEHQLRPLFAFFEALVLPTAVYATERDFRDGVLEAEPIRKRGVQAIEEAAFALASRGHRAGAERFVQQRPPRQEDERPSLFDRYWHEWIPRL